MRYLLSSRYIALCLLKPSDTCLGPLELLKHVDKCRHIACDNNIVSDRNIVLLYRRAQVIRQRYSETAREKGDNIEMFGRLMKSLGKARVAGF